MNAPVIEWMREEGIADEYITQLDWTKFEWSTASREEVEHITELHARFFKTKTVAEIIAEGIERRGAQIQPMYVLKEAVDHPQLKARGYWQQLEHPELGVTITYPGAFCKPSTTACGSRRRPPLIGEHNLEVYEKELGLSQEEIINLKQNGII
jgi:crotonobetainyl-CoA:carnitine CoA-transferase CaiB-like acyl-CoA transferase